MTAPQTPPVPHAATACVTTAGGASDCAPGLSPELRAELQRWHDWVLAGAPDCQPYRREWGLCANLDEHGGELLALFRGARFPFGRSEYYARMWGYSQHECPKRLAWVRKMLGVQS